MRQQDYSLGCCRRSRRDLHPKLSRSDVFNICSLKNRLVDKYDVTESFGFRDLQLNLEVGWSNGKIVPKENWGSQNVRKHVCEVQVMIKSFRDIIDNTASGFKWKNVGTAKPAQGRQLINDGLAAIPHGGPAAAHFGGV